MANVLVTGGAGYVGTRLTPHLLVFTVSRSLLEEWGWHLRGWLSAIDVLTWQGVVGYWIWVASCGE